MRRASVRRQMGDHNGAVDDLHTCSEQRQQEQPRYRPELLEYGNANYPAAMAGLEQRHSTGSEGGYVRYIGAVVARAHFHYLAAINDYQTIIDEKLYSYHGLYASIAECQYFPGDCEKALGNIDYALECCVTTRRTLCPLQDTPCSWPQCRRSGGRCGCFGREPQ